MTGQDHTAGRRRRLRFKPKVFGARGSGSPPTLLLIAGVQAEGCVSFPGDCEDKGHVP